MDNPIDLLRPDSSFAFYRPGAQLLFWAEARVFGTHTGAYIAWNAFLHALVAFALFRFSLVVLRSRLVALAAALAFAAGIGHFGKQVLWASSGGAITSTLLIITGITGYEVLISRDSRSPPAWTAFVSACVLAPAFHEIGHLIPILTVIAWFLRAKTHDNSGGDADRMPRLTALLAASIALAASSAWWFLRAGIPEMQGVYGGVSRQFFAGLPKSIRYLGLMVIPVQATDVLPALFFRAVAQAAVPMQWFTGGIAGITGAMVAWRTRDYRIPFAFMLIMLAAIGTVAVPHGWLELRYTYFAAPWFSMFLAVAFIRTRHRRIAVAVTVLVLLSTLAVTWILEHKYDRSSSPVKHTESLYSDG